MKIESYAVFINAKSYTYRYTCIVYICATLCQRSVPIQPVKYCWLNADSSFADLIRSPRIMTSCDGGVTYAAGGLPKLVFLHAGCTLKGIRTCVHCMVS